MIVSLIDKKFINSIILPNKISGQYWLKSLDKGQNRTKSVRIEAIDGVWVAKSGQDSNIIDSNGRATKEILLEESKSYKLIYPNNGESCIFTEPTTKGRKIFRKYLVHANTELSIGRNNNCDIVIENKLISSLHARLYFIDGNWRIKDLRSSNGTFVNRERVHYRHLNIGDCIYIMGFKLIIGKNFIAFNNPDDRVKLNTSHLLAYVRQRLLPSPSEGYKLPDTKYFYRSPRFERKIDSAIFKIDSPPSSQVREDMPWVLLFGSTLTMGLMSVAMLVSAVFSRNVLSVVMGAGMFLGSFFMPIITKKYEKKHRAKEEIIRKTKYREYLGDIIKKIDKESKLQIEILRENIPDIKTCERSILFKSTKLWSRVIGQENFLQIRLGLGDTNLNAQILCPERKFSINDDILNEELYSFCEKPQILKNVPISYSIYSDYISCIIGKRYETIEFIKAMAIQIAAMHSYDEVKLVFIFEEKYNDDLDFTKWLPHVWSDDKKFRFIATNLGEMKELSLYLEQVFEERIGINENEIKSTKPYFVIFSISWNLSVKMEILRRISSAKKNLNFSIINLSDCINNVPKESSIIIELSQNMGKIYNKTLFKGHVVNFKPDIQLNKDARSLSTCLANIKLDNISNKNKLPSMLTFLDMFEVAKVEHLNILSRWQENNASKTLEVPIGINIYGEAFKLDLHEKYHGPHGLIAGMTGSGKSEFIITYILSLALNFHPDEVAFVLIDYKGGGMAKSFENLPHTVGIITNLDGSSIKRSLLSFESELKRRQKIFSNTSKNLGISNIDIYKYQKLYREKSVLEPLQHLFIITDEFAELKTQQPEFMAQLVSAARIGRSLGIHLILATQKPSGVVDDQIWSNSKFKICLKVQEKADSMDMLKRQDAAKLTNTGRFYLQVGYNDLFELGQSAWAGAPYYPSDRFAKKVDNSITIIDKNGRTVVKVNPNKNPNFSTNVPSQLEAVVNHIKNIAADGKIKNRPLWLTPIPPKIILDEVKTKYTVVTERYKLDPIVGEYDDPSCQRQCVLKLPISEDGNTIIFGMTGSGKTDFLNAVIYSLIKEHSAEEVNIYLLDFASETLKCFAKAPQIGDVMLSHESEKIINLFKMLEKEISKRRKLFTDFGGDYISYIKNSKEKLPAILVVINSFEAFKEQYDKEALNLIFLSREGLKYGLYFILTAQGISAIRFNLIQNFKTQLVLQFGDKSEYSAVLGQTEGIIPANMKGRGLVKKDKLYEYQVASITKDELPYTFIAEVCRKIRENYKGKVAVKVPVLPEIVDKEFLKEHIDEKNTMSVPIAVETDTLEVYRHDFSRLYINMILSRNDEYKIFMKNFVSFVLEGTNLETVIFDPNNLITYEAKSKNIFTDIFQIRSEVSKLFDLVLYRNNTYKKAISENHNPERFEKLLVIINSLSELKKLLDPESSEKLYLILEKGSINYNISIVIADTAELFSSFSYESWYSRHISQINGIWIGSGISEQYQLKAYKVTSDMREELPANFAYIIKNGNFTKVKLLESVTKEKQINI